MRLFEIRRKPSKPDPERFGIEHTMVAQGVVFDDGRVVLAWVGEHPSVVVHTSIENVIAIHGHPGTRIIQIADLDRRQNGFAHLVGNCAQDDIEGVAHAFVSPPAKANHRYMWEQRQLFADLFREVFLFKGTTDAD